MTWHEAAADPALYADPGAMHRLFARLRAERPVVWCAPEGFAPFWLLSRYEDVAAVSRADHAFTSRRRTVLFDRETEAALRSRAAAQGERAVVRSLATMDNPEHQAYRRLTQGWFTPANLRALEAKIRLIAERSVSEMLARGGRCDFAADVAAWYPLRVIMAILGLDERHEALMLRLTQELFTPEDAIDPGGGRPDLGETLEEFRAFFAEVSADRRRRPTDDLSSLIANGEIDGAPLGELEAFSYYNIIATAGHETTSSTAAAGLLALCEDPLALAQLRDGASLAVAVEEMIRWASPVRHFMRVAREPFELAGVHIAPGDAVMLLYPSANRDETAFDAPDRFRVDRSPNRHLGFGIGPHTCLGMNLARLELRILFEVLLARTNDWRLAGQAVWTRSTFVGGPKSVPLAFSAA